MFCSLRTDLYYDSVYDLLCSGGWMLFCLCLTLCWALRVVNCSGLYGLLILFRISCLLFVGLFVLTLGWSGGVLFFWCSRFAVGCFVGGVMSFAFGLVI